MRSDDPKTPRPSGNASSRRAFLRGGFLKVMNENASLPHFLGGDAPRLRLGVLTDAHYADAEPKGTRFYRESLGKLREASDLFARRGVDAVIEIGDLIDAGPKPDAAQELAWLRAADTELARAQAERHYVLGNHCVSTLTKLEFLRAVGKRQSHYSFDLRGVHIVLLDACFRRDGVAYQAGNFEWTDTDIPLSQREWLAADLEATRLPTLVFCHQRLDTPAGSEHGVHGAAEVRAILERTGRVKAVFMGHSHQNELTVTQGIAYATVAAMVEGSGPANSSYAIVSVNAAGAVEFEGFRRAAQHPWNTPPKPDGGAAR